VAGLYGCARPQRLDAIRFTLVIAEDKNQTLAEPPSPDTTDRAMLFDPDTLACRGIGEYRDLDADSEVVVLNERREEIGSAPLGSGKVYQVEPGTTGNTIYRGCRFQATIPLRSAARIYIVNLGDGEFVVQQHFRHLQEREGKLTMTMP
jgi:hypothetical protein